MFISSAWRLEAVAISDLDIIEATSREVPLQWGNSAVTEVEGQIGETGNEGMVVNDPNGFVCSTCCSLSSTLMPWLAVVAEVLSVSGTGRISPTSSATTKLSFYVLREVLRLVTTSSLHIWAAGRKSTQPIQEQRDERRRV